MTMVVFHLIEDPTPEAYWYYAANLCAQAVEAGHLLYVVCQDHGQVEFFDEYLWGYRPDAFVPHTADPEDIEHAPIFLGVDPVAGGFDYVMNLAGRPIARVAERVQLDELVNDEPAHREAARARWRSYQAEGLRPVHRPVAQVAMGAD